MDKHKQFSVDEMMLLVQQGDKQAFALLLDALMDGCYYFAEQMLRDPSLSEEVVQQCFATVWEKKHHYTAKGNAKTWIYTILYHICIDTIRENQKHQPLSVSQSPLLTVNKSALDVAIQDEQQQLLLHALSELSAQEKALLFLFYYHGHKQKQICEILDMSVSAVESGLFRIRTKLKRILL